MKKGCIVLHLLCSLFIQSCISDSIKNLGSGYFYRDEGENIKDILCQNSNISITMNILLQNRSLNILKNLYTKENMNMEQTIVYSIG